MKPVLIIGGGISGLSTAYWLTKNNIPCEVIEKSDRFGGLLASEQTPFGLIESAANGFLADGDILELCEDLGVQLASRKKTRKKKYIFRKQPRRWPLKLKESLQFLCGLWQLIFSRKKFSKIEDKETVSQWAEKRFGKAAADWLISPALQGVYAGNPQRMSARLIFGSLVKKRSKPTSFKGTLAPEGGMGELVHSLETWLTKKDVLLSKNKEVSEFDHSNYSGLVIATSSFELNKLSDQFDDLVPTLNVEPLPLVSVTLFFDPASTDIKGFGCLFPRKEGFYSLGVLFNECIFEGRSPKRSETWILGGAFHKNAARFSDEEILRQIKEDRKRLYNLNDHAPILHYKISKWEEALPHMNLDLEEQLYNLKTYDGVYLSGNYLGKIGISQIVSRNKELAKKIREDLFQ